MYKTTISLLTAFIISTGVFLPFSFEFSPISIFAADGSLEKETIVYSGSEIPTDIINYNGRNLGKEAYITIDGERYPTFCVDPLLPGAEGHPIKIVTPILSMTKSEIVKYGKELNAPLHLTWSCYYGGEKACGHCDSCLLRLKGFADAGYKDEVDYK